jgi:aminoglycoside phosphotransferase (APT) family kinase protein
VSDAAREERVVHADFADRSPVLRQGARLTGVLDWDAAGRGGRGHDLALLFYDAFAQADRLDEAPAEEVVNRLGQRGLDVSGARRSASTSPTKHSRRSDSWWRGNPKHTSWRASLARRVLTAYRRLAAG